MFQESLSILVTFVFSALVTKISKFDGKLERILRMAILIMVMSLFIYVFLMMDVMFLEDI